MNERVNNNEIIIQERMDRAIELFNPGGELYRFTLSLCRNPDLTQDVVQEVFLRLQKFKEHLLKLNEPEDLKFWLKRVAKNTFLTYMKMKKRPDEVDLDEKKLGRLFSTSTKPKEETRLIVNEILSKLPKFDAEILRLKYIKNHSIEEIGEMLEVNPNSVGSFISRAKERFLKIYNSRGLIRT